MSKQLLPVLLALYAFAILLPRLDDAFTRVDRAEPVDEQREVSAKTAREASSAKNETGATPSPEVECSRSGTKADVTFYWQPPEGTLEQWLDLSTQDNGFQRPSARSAGPLSPDAHSYDWDDLTDNVPWFWRVNARTKDGWRALPTRVLTPCGAQGLASDSHCTDGAAAVDFRWTPSSMKIVSQWLDVSAFDNGFVPGTFRSVGPMSGDTAKITWESLPGAAVVWRLNTLTSKGWIGSETRPIAACDLPTPLHPRFTCTSNGAVVEFRWALGPQSEGQWLDLSRDLNGFVQGTFVSSGRLDPRAESFVWLGVVPNEPHYYRINARGANGWRTSVTRSFVAVCPPS